MIEVVVREQDELDVCEVAAVRLEPRLERRERLDVGGPASTSVSGVALEQPDVDAAEERNPDLDPAHVPQAAR